MSHTSTIKGVQIKSKWAIKQAVADLVKEGIDVKLVENAMPRMYYTRQAQAVGKCDFVLKLGNARYDVGLKYNKETQEYDAILDTWASSISSQIGASCQLDDHSREAEHAIGKFTQRYGVNAAKEAARNMGYDILGETVDDDGTVHLELNVG
jgi:hypothetical protein